MAVGGVFYYDLGSPYCYLVAERLPAALPAMPEWEPVLASELSAVGEAVDRDVLERHIISNGMQPLRWPAQWPPDTRLAMLAATYAKQVGRGVAFSLAGFRQAFAGGRDLADPNTVLIAAAACEMHPRALLKAVDTRSVSDALERATSRARGEGIEALPALRLGTQVIAGTKLLDRALETPP